MFSVYFKCGIDDISAQANMKNQKYIFTLLIDFISLLFF